jgi:hypothetical protein
VIRVIRNNPLYAALFAAVSFVAAVYVNGAFFTVRAPRQRPACIANLRMIQEAKEQWALETKRTNGAPGVDAEIDQYIKGGRPKCPKGGSYIYGNVGELPRCTFPAHQNILTDYLK